MPKRKPKQPTRLPRHYSGDDSVEFWERVGAFGEHQHGSALYQFACILQSAEAHVLSLLEQMEDERAKA